MLSRRPARTTIAALVAFTAVLTTLSSARADTRTAIANAEQRLHALEAQITSEQASLVGLESTIRDSVVKVAEGRRLYDAIQAQLLVSQKQHADIEARYASIRAQIDAVAVGAYVGGPGVGSLSSLDPLSVRDATDAVQYLSSIVDHKETLAEEAQTLGAQLKAREAQEATVMTHRAAALDQLQSDQNTLMSRFGQQQQALAQMAQARAQISALLVQLAKKLRAEEIAAARLALEHGVTFGKWATAFLGSTGAPIERNNLVVMVAWETAEYTSARWNPLATTYYMRGSTCYNPSCVRNYLSLEQGLQATYGTLRRPGLGYGPILSDLSHNADPMDTAKAINASMWCNGCANGQYVVDLVPSVESNYDAYANASAN
ncbi:MAG TPA: hypothetical protein VKV69_06175 [Actinomycetota bacterium]|nr:hypothetical protein [Actinomycetota bacterium]